MDTWIHALVSPRNESIETEISWHKSTHPDSLVQKLLDSNHNIPSIINFFTDIDSPPMYQSYGYTTLLQFQTIGMTRLSSILMRMNHTSTSLVLSQIVQIHLNTNHDDSNISQQPKEIQYLSSILLYALQPMAGLTSASATIWRSICDISQRYSKYIRDIHIVRDAKNCLVEQVIQPGMESACSCTLPSSSAAVAVAGLSSSGNGKKMAKLLKFFLCRLETFMELESDSDEEWTKECNILNHNHHDDDQVQNVIMYLLLWRGQVELSTLVDIQHLGRKIDECLEKWVLCSKKKDTMIDWWKVQILLKWNTNQRNHELFYSYGKLVFLVHLVQTLVPSYSKQGEMNTDEWEGLLSLVESLLFHIIPSCHELVTTLGDSSLIMTRTLGSISDVLLLLERYPSVSNLGTNSTNEPSCRFSELHQHLMKWLAQCHPPSSHRNPSMVVVHPLTYELVQTTIYLHVIRSYSLDSTQQSCIVSHMMGLCSKLLFSDRTHNTLRSNISTLMFQILSNDSLPSLKMLCESFVIIEAQAFVLNLKVKSSGKRKRNEDQYQRWKDLDGYVDLQPVFSKVLNDVFWARLGDSKRDNLIRDIEVLLLLQENEESQCNRLRILTKQAPTLLSFVSSMLLNAPFVHQKKKEQTVRSNLNSITYENDSFKHTLSLCRQLSEIVDQKLGIHDKMVPLIQRVLQTTFQKPTTSQKFGMCIVLPSLCTLVNNNVTGEFIKVRVRSKTVCIANP
jgi:hypothetical protein